jgi:cysteine desulfuration protein SufE
VIAYVTVEKAGDMTIDDLKSDFALLDDWEERYRYVIELGRDLPPLADADHRPENKVSGCASQVWLTSTVTTPGADPVLHFMGDSDALIVKGLVAIAFLLFQDKRASEIARIDAADLMRELGLADHLTAQRSNGFASMIRRIKSDAAAALQSSTRGAISGR